MTVYRTGNHHGVTINREDDRYRCQQPGHDCPRGHIVGMVANGQFLTGDPALSARVHNLLRGDPPQDTDWDLAARICELLNDGATAEGP